MAEEKQEHHEHDDQQERDVVVKRVFGSRAMDDGPACTVRLRATDSIWDVKTKICDALRADTEYRTSNIGPDELMIHFGPVDRKLGRQYMNDPAVDESRIFLHMYSILEWLERFPEWGLSVSFLPPTPPAPGVAIHKAAAMAENKDPDKAVAEARRNGEIPHIRQLSAPWGPKPYVAPSKEQLMELGYEPAAYPDTFSPLSDVSTDTLALATSSTRSIAMLGP